MNTLQARPLSSHDLDIVVEGRVRHVADHPLTIDEFIAICEDGYSGRYVELVKGMIEEKPMVQWDHEQLLQWLIKAVGGYVTEREIGETSGSRTLLEIDKLHGRLPDFLFIANDRLHLVEQTRIYGAPNLVMEIRSPSDPNTNVVELQGEYEQVGVDEIIFVQPLRKLVRVLRKRNNYKPDDIHDGVVRLESIENLALKTEWLYDGKLRPKPKRLIEDWLADLGEVETT